MLPDLVLPSCAQHRHTTAVRLLAWHHARHACLATDVRAPTGSPAQMLDCYVRYYVLICEAVDACQV